MTGKRTRKKIIMEKILHRAMDWKRLFPLFLLMLTACVSCTSTKKLTVGEEFKIVLEGEGDGGFSWQFVENPEIVLTDSLKIDKEKENGLSEYSKVFVLKSLKSGSYILQFKKIRSFDPDLILEGHLKEITVNIKK